MYLSRLQVHGLRASADPAMGVSPPWRFAVVLGPNRAAKTTATGAAHPGLAIPKGEHSEPLAGLKSAPRHRTWCTTIFRYSSRPIASVSDLLTISLRTSWRSCETSYLRRTSSCVSPARSPASRSPPTHLT